MQELVEMVRRDHALLDDMVREEDPGLAEALEAHLAFLDLCVGPPVERLGNLAASEWTIAREALLDARELADAPGSGSAADLAEVLGRHATQMEQIVLPRLVGELTEPELSELTAEALARHDQFGPSAGGPTAMRAELTDAGPDASRPAGA